MMRDGAAARLEVRLAQPDEKVQLRVMLADYLGELAASVRSIPTIPISTLTGPSPTCDGPISC